MAMSTPPPCVSLPNSSLDVSAFVGLAGQIIGPGGKMIKQIIEDFELDSMDVQDDGRVMISSFNNTRAAK